MRDGCYAGLLAVMLLVAGGCGIEPIPEPPPMVPTPLADRVTVPADAAKVERRAVRPADPADAGEAAADPVPDVGPGRNLVVDQEGNVIDHGPMGTPPDSTDLRALQKEESLQKTKEMVPGGL